MIRLVYMSGRWIGKEISSVEDDADNIQEFANSMEPVMIVGSIEDLEDVDIDIDRIEMVD